MSFRSPLTLKRMKAPPPGETGQESIYLKTIGEKQTQVSVKLLTGEVFWISDLTVEVQTYRDQSLLGFNGTTEWALDSVTLDQALWLPREDQLRELLGDRLESVHRTEAGWEVTYAVKPGYVHAVTDADLECAYAKALLTL